jgi:hypothetical protein
MWLVCTAYENYLHSSHCPMTSRFNRVGWTAGEQVGRLKGFWGGFPLVLRSHRTEKLWKGPQEKRLSTFASSTLGSSYLVKSKTRGL